MITQKGATAMKLEIRPAPHCCETRETLAAIARLLDRKEWDSDTLNAVADAIRAAERKMHQCIKLARQSSRDSWQEPQPYRTRYRQISREAMEDARYWHAELQLVTPYV